MRERIKFETALLQLHDDVAQMIQDVSSQYISLRKALVDMDRELAESLISKDEAINQKERAINEFVISLIIKESPVASDLRAVITAMKIASDLERIADYVCNISKYIIHTKTQTELAQMFDTFFEPLLTMFEKINTAYSEENVELALNVAHQDEELDELFDRNVKILINTAKDFTDSKAEEAARALFVIKNLERAGDHLTNISESIVYLHKAKRITLN
jgi:phosphate transport system protein